jgi:hypothetical protein
MRRSLFALIAPIALTTLAGCEPSTDPDPGTPVNLSYAPCIGGADFPEWFAYQDGSAEWTRVNVSSSGAFNFTLRRGKGGIATYTADNGLFVLYATTEELQANLSTCDGGSVRAVSGTVTGYAPLDNMDLVMGSVSTTVFGSQSAPASFAISDVGAAETDLVGIRYRTAATTTSFERFPSRIFIRRGVTGTTTGLIDFASATESFAPLPQAVTVTNLAAGESLNIFSNVVMGSTTANISRYAAAAASFSGSVSAPFYAVPGSALAGTETQMLEVSALKSASGTQDLRLGTLVYTNAADKTVTFGPTLGPISVTGTSRPAATYANVQSEYDNAFEFSFSQGNGFSFRQVDVAATRGYLGTTTSVTLAVPDLNGAGGFSQSWLPVTGTQGNWIFIASNGSISTTTTVASMAAARTGTLTP